MKTSILLVLFMLTFSAHAADSLSYSGRLVNTDGSPVSGPVSLRFELAYTGTTSGTVRCWQDMTTVPLTNGVFHVKLNLDCGTATLKKILLEIPPGESAAIRVVHGTKTYSYQALHSMPFAMLAEMAKTLSPLPSSEVGKVLQWDGTNWVPAAVGTGDGTVKSITAGTGLSGGVITDSGTVAIATGGVDTAQLANFAVTNDKVAAGIDRTKLAGGIQNYVVVNDSVSGLMTAIPNLTIAQGGTGATTAADARTNLGLGTAATLDVGYVSGGVMPGFELPVCLTGQKLHFTGAGPSWWSCISEDGNDNSKLPLIGGTMLGAINMGGYPITNLGAPTNNTDAATKAYVDATVGGHWTLSSGNLYRSTGRVGIGTATPEAVLDITSTTSGLLIPRMSEIERDAIIMAPALKGMQIFNTTSGTINYWDGSWKELGLAGSGVTSIATSTGLLGGTITSTGTLSVDVGVTTGKIVQVTTGDKLPVIDGSNLTNLNTAQITIGTLPVARGGTGLSALGTANQVLGVNSLGDTPEYKSIVGGTGLSVAHTANTVTLTVTGASPTGTAGGDLSGTYPNPSVDAIQGTAVSATLPTAGQILVLDAGTWTPKTVSGDATMDNTGALTLGTVPVSKGGTGLISLPNSRILGTSSTGVMQGLSCNQNEVLSFDSTGNYLCQSLASLSASFVNGGNSFGAAAVLGTNDANSLSFETGGTTKMTILTDGNIGIGTTTPKGILDLGDGTGGRSIVWGGGSGHYNSLGSSYSSAALSLVHGLKLSTTADQYLYSHGTQARAGVRVGSFLNGDISFFNAPSSAQIEGNAFDHSVNTKMIIKESGYVGVGTTTPAAILDLASTSSGILIPRMTTLQRDAIASVPNGTQVYNTSTNELNYYDGTGWKALGVAGSGITTFNGLSASSQSLALGTAGTAPAWSSATSTHTLNIPMASSAGVTAGLLSKAEYDALAGKEGAIAAGTTTQYYRGDKTWATLDTSVVPENTNLYFTDTRARAALSATTPVTYNATTGVIALGTVPVSQGGTGLTSTAANSVVTTSSTGSYQFTACLNDEFVQFDTILGVKCGSIPSQSGDYIQNGNSFGANAVLGTNDNFPLIFETNGTLKMTVLADGKVGIGTATPQHKLQVQSSLASTPTIAVSTDPDQAILDNNILGQFIFRADDDSYPDMIAGGIQMLAKGSGAPARWGGGTGFGASGSHMVFNVLEDAATATVSEKMRITSSGNVGIGTTSPSGRLHTEDTLLNQVSCPAGYTMGDYDADTVADDCRAIGIVVKANGSVGIGTTSPTDKLHIENGSMMFSSTTHSANERNYRVGAFNGAAGGPGTFTIKPRNDDGSYKAEGLSVNSSGRIGANHGAPTANLHIGQGGTAANSAPLKIQAGALLTTPEIGAVEYDGVNLFYTDGTGVRRTLASEGGTSSFTNVSSISGPGAISIAAGGTNQNVTLAASGTGSVISSSPMSVTSTTSSTSPTTGAMTVSGGMGVAENINAGGSIKSGSVFIAPLGTAVAPSYTFDGDLNTGVFSPGADLLGISTAGVERLRVDSSGNVGIGTTSPSGKLTINSNGLMTDTDAIRIQKGSTDEGAWLNFQQGVNGWRTGMPGTFGDADPYALVFYYGASTPTAAAPGTEMLRFSTSGNAGIGTASPSGKLHVHGGAAHTNIYFDTANTGGWDMRMFATAGDSGGVSALNLGYAAAPAYAGISRGSDNKLHLTSGGSGRVTVDTVGNVGIGTTNPTNKLEVVAGTGLWTAVNADGSLTVNRDGAPPYISFQGSGGGGSMIYNRAEGTTGRSMEFRTTADGGVMTEKMRITGSGNVGIGTSSPADRFTVSKGHAPRITLEDTTIGTFRASINHWEDTNGGLLLLTSNSYLNDSGNWAWWDNTQPSWAAYMDSRGTADNYTIYRSPAGGTVPAMSPILSLRGNGNVGIGTTSPAVKLDLRGGGMDMHHSGTHVRHFNSAGTQRIYEFLDDPNNHYTFYSNSGAGALLSMQYISGNVGVGTIAPAEKLHVTGKVHVVGQNFKSDTSGNTTYWGGGKQHGYTVYGVEGGDGAPYTYGSINTTTVNYNGGKAGGRFIGGNGYHYAGGGAGLYAQGGDAGPSSTSNQGGAGIFARGGLNGDGGRAYAGFFEGNVAATGTITGSVVNPSDRRLKDNIEVVKGLPLIMQLSGVTWTWKKDGSKDMGLIAQEVEKVFPWAVSTDEMTGMKGVKYQAFIAPLIESTKELAQEDKKIHRKIASLEEENLELKAKNERMEKMLIELSQRLQKLESSKK